MHMKTLFALSVIKDKPCHLDLGPVRSCWADSATTEIADPPDCLSLTFHMFTRLMVV